MFAESPIRLMSYHYKGPQATFDNAESTYDSWGMLAVDQGVFAYGVGEESGTASFGDLVFCPPGTPLHREALKPLSLYFLVFQPNEPTSSWTEADRSGQQFMIPTGKVTLHDHARLASDFAYIRQCALPKDKMRRKFLAHIVFDLIFLCAAERLKSGKQGNTLVQQAADYIRAHFAQPLRLQDIAARFGFNQSQFTRKFQTEIGLNPLDYLTSLRLETARALLLETEDTIEAVASRCGFQSGFYLSRVFTANMQLSPSEYRKKYRL